MNHFLPQQQQQQQQINAFVYVMLMCEKKNRKRKKKQTNERPIVFFPFSSMPFNQSINQSIIIAVDIIY